MAETTKNLDLKKPSQEDFYNIDDFNENFQKIDDFAQGVNIHINDTKTHVKVNDSGGVAIGNSTNAHTGVAIGNTTNAESGGAIGNGAETTSGGAIGNGACTSQGFAGGDGAKTMDDMDNLIDAIQLGTGRNTKEKTLQVYNFQMMKEDGKIPSERLPISCGQEELTPGTSELETGKLYFVYE